MAREVTVTLLVKRGIFGKDVPNGPFWMPYIDRDIVNAMPFIPYSGQDEETVKFMFFNLGHNLHPTEVESERKKRGLVQDIAAQLQYNKLNRNFCGSCPNGDSWQGPDGKWYYFNLSHGSLHGSTFGNVVVSKCNGGDWYPEVWFGGQLIE